MSGTNSICYNKRGGKRRNTALSNERISRDLMKKKFKASLNRLNNEIRSPRLFSSEIKTAKSPFKTEKSASARSADRGEEVDRSGSAPATGSYRGRRRAIFRVSLLVFAVILIAGGIILIFKRPVVEEQRKAQAHQIASQIRVGEVTVIVDRDAFEVEGEGYEIFEDELNPPDPESELFALPEKVTLTAVGIITIDSIDLILPLWDNAGIIPLRYGAGIHDNTVVPGQEGNLVILGHRMKTYGSIFNRLGEVKNGDTAEIVTMDGSTHIYVVDRIIEALPPRELPEYIESGSGEGAQLTLVTCTPTGVGSHRLVIIGHLSDE